jgi:TolB-like protein/DNA-binding SARP family transcriptional activator/tetratricopeptide (TPR) repeat protein
MRCSCSARPRLSHRLGGRNIEPWIVWSSFFHRLGVGGVFTLETFGGLSLRRADGPVTGRTSQRRRLALLALLAAERRPVSRDKLLAFFWPDADAERARHLLADTLYVLRAGLGEAAIRTVGDDLAMNEDVVGSDVAVFLRALDDKEWERAVAISADPFLDGIFVSDAPEFERWAESMRSRLEGERRRCLERLAADAGSRGDHANAIKWWRMFAAADPLSSRAAMGLLRALSDVGDRAAALQFARVHEEMMRGELDADPDPAVATLVARIRASTDQPRTPLQTPSPRTAEHVEPPPSTRAEETTPERTAARPRPPWRRRAVLGSIVSVVTLASVAAVVYARAGARSIARTALALPSPRDSSPSIAVLPFQSISSDREADYVADGVTDALTNELDVTLRMPIVSKTSAAAAWRSGDAISAVGQRLGVRYVVEGSVRLSSGMMRIDARLVRAHDDRVLWSEVYSDDFSPRSIMQVETAIARAIATALNVRLAGDAALVSRRAPHSVEALDDYNRGRFFLQSRSPDGVGKAIEYFQRAIRLDSTYAAAHAGLADGYASFAIGNIGDYRADEYFPLSRAEAKYALSLDSTLAEAHAALGYFDVLYQLDWASADREVSRALDLQPSYSTARSYRAILDEWTGRYDRALSEAQIARALDPLSLFTNVELARAYFFNAQYDAAERQLRATLDLDPASLRAHMLLGQVLEHQRRFDDAIRELTISARLPARTSRPLALLAHAYAAAGRTAGAMAILDSLQTRAATRYVPAFDFAVVHEALGHTDEALDWLDRAVADHSIRPYLMDPTFDAIRSQPRFTALLERLNLPTRQPRR